MTNLIAIPLGWLMYLIYSIVHSYGISIIIFTLIVKLLTLPSTYQMQVNSARQGLIAPKLNKLKKSFANNPTRYQEEQNKLFQEEGINPTSGCLGNFITMFLLLGVYRVVLQPLTFILRISKDELAAAKQILIDLANDGKLQNVTEKAINARSELMILRFAKSDPAIFSSLSGFTDKLQGFENNFLGFDLTGMPSLHPEQWDFTAFMLILLPVLSTIVQLVMTIVSQSHMKKVNPAAQSMGGMTLMLYAMPFMTLWIGMEVPAGLSFYWFVNGILSLVMMLALYKYLTGDRLVKINEKEKAKQIAKGPSWMQRMMDASAEMAAQENGGASRSEANRTRYADGDDGMSRKERAEYERKLIEARRRAVALKYGDELPDSDDSDLE